MTKLRIFYGILILIAYTTYIHSESWNMGHDVGYRSGYDTAILEGKVTIECKVPCREGRVREL